ncbi:hypothetical protein PR202_ga07080 [Eleusine coracana subsp. coracana]|uniref:Ion transport domain-containing protein n=1 Tax=Eleusine coracana subsp. coracana TaxID=191504 RepID=A0AAV5BYD4_ELECO|nr:hypothetical protein PR202_ga07080 [Eleusine coracana subsp. coracana]
MKPETRVYDPQGPFMQRWNKIFVISCLISVAVDSLFFYTPAIDGDNNCVYLDEKLEIIASILRSLVDVFYVLRIVFQFRTGFFATSSRVFGPRVLVKDARAIAKRYLSTNFLVDFLAVLPLPQVFVLYVLPDLFGSEANLQINAVNLYVLYCTQLSSCGQNLKTSPHIWENLFAVFVSTSGLVLFALLIGNVQVPMFENMDDQLLDAMCDRLKPMLYTEGSCIIAKATR